VRKLNNNIKSVIGIGELSAIVLLHLFLKYPDANKKQLVSLVGLDPTRFDSGSSIHKKSKISKAGAKIYRGVLSYTSYGVGHTFSWEL